MITFRTIILSTLIVDKVKQLTGLIAGDEQARDMWTTPLSPTGELPATHYISSGIISDEFASLLPLYENGIKIYNGQTEYISTATGVDIGSIENLFSLMYVSEEDSITAINRLQLNLINNF